jgi:hypothetical protein
MPAMTTRQENTVLSPKPIHFGYEAIKNIIPSLVARLTPGEITLHSNKDRHICIKTHAKVSPETSYDKHPKFTPKGIIISNRSICHDTKFRVLKIAEIN